MSPVDQILFYIKNFLELPHPAFAGLPPCPFARKERLDNAIFFFEETFGAEGPSEHLLQSIRDFDEKPDLTTFLAYDIHVGLNPTESVRFAQQITDKLSDIEMLAISIHPQDDFNVDGVETRCGPFVMMLVQRRSVLDAAKTKLSKTAYYDNWQTSDEELLSEIDRLTGPVFFPLIWWTEQVIEDVLQGKPHPQPTIGSTVEVMTIDKIHNWFVRFGELHGWREASEELNLSGLLQLVRSGSFVVLTEVDGRSTSAILLAESTDEKGYSFLPSSAEALLAKKKSHAKFWIHSNQ